MLRALSVAVAGVVLFPREARARPLGVDVGHEVRAEAGVEGAGQGGVRAGGCGGCLDRENGVSERNDKGEKRRKGGRGCE